MSGRARKAAIAAYAAIAVITFGHAAAGRERYESSHGCQAVGLPCQSGVDPLAGVAAAGLWPLYWSWEAFS